MLETGSAQAPELKVSAAQPSEDAHLASKHGLFPKYRFRSLGWHLPKLQGEAQLPGERR